MFRTGLRLGALGGAAIILILLAPFGGAVAQAKALAHSSATVTVFATGLNNPRGLAFGPDGNLSALLSRTALVPGFLGTLISNGLEIAGWVSLWRPIEIFLYEWWPYWRENQLYSHVMNMQIVIEEEKETEH